MKKIIRRYEFYLVLIILVLSIVFGSINPAFFSLSNLYDLLKSNVTMGIFAIGVLIVLISGGIDVSFTSIAAFSMYISIKILLGVHYSGSVSTAFLLAGSIGMLLGLFNAVFISVFKLPTLIVTLGTASVFRGFMLAFIGTDIITNLPGGIIKFSKLVLLKKYLPSGEMIGLSFSCIIFFLIAIIVCLLLRYTMLGRGIYAMGGDIVSAKRVGFNLIRLQLFIYGFSGFLSGIAGIIHSSMMRNANPFDLVGTELIVIAAVVLGGANITGGYGTILGIILGVFLIVLINNSLILLGIPSYWQRVSIGLIIIVSTGITVYNHVIKKRN